MLGGLLTLAAGDLIAKLSDNLPALAGRKLP